MFINPRSLTVTPERQSDDDVEVNSTADLEVFDGNALVKLYNRAVPSSPIRKFVNKATGITRVFPLLESMARGPVEDQKDKSSFDGWDLPPEAPPRGAAPKAAAKRQQKEKDAPQSEEAPSADASQEDTTVATATKKSSKKGSKKSATKPATNGKRGRAPGLAGMRLVRVGDEFPGRKDSVRNKAWDLVPAAGITYEKFIEKGGDPAALAFNIRTKRTKVEKA